MRLIGTRKVTKKRAAQTHAAPAGRNGHDRPARNSGGDGGEPPPHGAVQSSAPHHAISHTRYGEKATPKKLTARILHLWQSRISDPALQTTAKNARRAVLQFQSE